MLNRFQDMLTVLVLFGPLACVDALLALGIGSLVESVRLLREWLCGEAAHVRRRQTQRTGNHLRFLRMDSRNLTAIRHSASLSHTQLLKYLAFLERNGLIIVEREGAKVLPLQVSDKRRLVVCQIKKLNELLGL